MINIKLRLKNKTTLVALLTALISGTYEVLDILGIVPPIPQEAVASGLSVLVTVLVCLGIVVDPTTHGISDSERAMGYVEPNKE